MNSLYRAILSTPLNHIRPRTLAAAAAAHAYSTRKTASTTAKASAYRTTKYPPSEPQKESKAQQPSSELGSSSGKDSREWERPKEIPYQPKLVNWVNMIGYVHSPALTTNMVSVDDLQHKFTAFSLLYSQTKHPHSLRIPILFEGDLAHIAACHLKENDYIYIGGHLTPLHPAFDVHQELQANFQVVVQNINFVEKPDKAQNITSTLEQEKAANRSVLPEPKAEKGTDLSASMTKQMASEPDHWRELVDNPKQWRDFRSNKISGSVKPKHPDFKQKDTGIALWLNDAPRWVLSKLEQLECDTSTIKSGQQKVKKGEESWKALIENPDKWWDNRLTKKNVKGPDFKHKDTGEALWLNDSPAWVQEKLPSPKAKQGAAL